MEYLTQFKKFLKTNNGSDTHSLATLEHSSHFSPVQTATYTTLYICICRRTFSYRRNIDALVVYGNCVMTVNDGTTPTYTYIHTYIDLYAYFICICLHRQPPPFPALQHTTAHNQPEVLSVLASVLLAQARTRAR